MQQQRSLLYDKHISFRSSIENDSQAKYQQEYSDQDNKFTSLTKLYEQQQKRKFLQLQNSNMLTNFRLKNEKQKQEKIDEKQRSRRSRKDKQGRDYKCGCGKTYLSYPALYTHIKQKHESKEPEGTTRLNSKGPNKRGRPRRTRNPTKTELPRVLTQKMMKDTMTVFEQYEDAVHGNIFPQESITFQVFNDQIENIKKEQTKQISVKTPIDEVFAIYLYNMADLCNNRFFSYLEETMICLRSCMNQHYKTFLKNYQSSSNIYTMEILVNLLKGKLYSQVYSCEYLPLISEFFILEYAPRKMKKIDQKLTICIIQDICSWLYEKKLTHLKLARYSSETIPNLEIGQMRNR